MTTDLPPPTESSPPSLSAPQFPRQMSAPQFPRQMSTPHGYYTFVPYPGQSGIDAMGPPSPAGPAPQASPAVPAPAAPTDPAAIAAVAAAHAALAAIPPRPAGYVHVVTGIPPGLAALLRSTGPWTANVLYSVPPTGALGPVNEIVAAPEWYCVTRGRFVGVFDQYAQAHWAIRGVSNAVHKSYSSQAFALAAFNQVVMWGGIEVA